MTNIPNLTAALIKGDCGLEIFADLSIEDCYYIVKTYKTIDITGFLRFWQSGIPKDILHAILDKYYPPLVYNHLPEDGLPLLVDYIKQTRQLLSLD